MTKVYTYKLLRGQHAHQSIAKPNNKKTASEIVEKGQVFKTTTNMEEKFGPSASMKFELIAVDDELTPTAKAKKPEPSDEIKKGSVQPDKSSDSTEYWDEEETSSEVLSEAPEPDYEDEDEFDSMTLPQLRAFARENDIDLGTAKRKSDVVEAIRDELAGRD